MSRPVSSWHETARRRPAAVAAAVCAVIALVGFALPGGAAALRAGPGAGHAAVRPALSSVPLEPPEIESFSPVQGPVGTLVTVKGYWFAADAQVRFNGVVASSVRVTPFTQLECTVPAGATSGPITVSTSFGTGTSRASFTVTGAIASGWTGLQSGTTRTLRATAAVSAQKSWAVGDGGTIVVTADGGTTWRPQTSGTTADLRSVIFIDAVHGMAVGSSGTVLVTSDGGSSWDKAPAGTTTDLTSVAASGATAWVVGDSGAILVTHDGGGSWTEQESGTTADLSAVTSTDSTHAWATGENGTILATDDGGQTWRQQTSGTTADLTSVTMGGERSGWAVGDRGAIVVTGDGGTTWRPQTSGTTVDLASVTSSGTKLGWATGRGGTILVTGNGGTTWKPQPTGSTADLGGIDFADAKHGLVVGSGGVILATVTGGEAPRPMLLKLSPAAAKRKAAVVVSGLLFGSLRGTSSVKFGGKKCTAYLSWSDRRVVCRVPAKAKIGKVKVTVTTPAGTSNTRSFRVKR